jgi:crossover junction endodeoxyribonuclease RuvC
MTTETIVGIDRGAHGAIAVLNEGGDLLDVLDMPSTPEANGGSATNAPLLARIIARTHARIAFLRIRRCASDRCQGCGVRFRSRPRVIEGCAGALGLPVVFLTPTTWKRFADIPPGADNKDLARTRAIARWSARADLFARKCDVDRAEAALIAFAGLKRKAARTLKTPTTQSKEPIMPKKSKPEPKASEPEKPYEMTPPETDGEEHIVACCAQKRSRGREPGFRMSEEHRTKIQNSRILRVLIDHIEGREEISPARVTAALGLLKKVLPDLQAVTVGGDPANPLRHEHAIDLSSMSDKDLAELVRGGAVL